MRFAREGYPFMLAGSIAAASAWATAAAWDTRMALPAAVLTVLAAFVCYFFRDPERAVPTGEGTVLAPADGKIIDVREVDEPSFLGGPCRRITVFLNVFNVHVQRAPVSGRVVHREYRAGEYAVAWHPKASEANEQASVGLRTPRGRVLVRQIAGLIARRIVTYPEVGDDARQGDRIGLIRFGSRVDLFIPLDWPLRCAIDDKVVGGSTVCAQVSERASEHEGETNRPVEGAVEPNTQEASA